MLQGVTECYRVLQSISSASTWANFWACYFTFTFLPNCLTSFPSFTWSSFSDILTFTFLPLVQSPPDIFLPCLCCKQPLHTYSSLSLFLAEFPQIYFTFTFLPLLHTSSDIGLQDFFSIVEQLASWGRIKCYNSIQFNFLSFQ